jgi:NAD(P)-dependent dehydrogenase (short-subunit alcohol dehydrogenase family)
MTALVGQPSLPLAGRVVVVTGGAGLLGRAFVRAIADAGGTAVVADVNLAAAETVVAGLPATAGRALAVGMDITSADSVSGAIAAVLSACGRVDAVVNNAYPRNAAYGRRLEDVTYADFCENLSVHVGGYFLVAQQFAQHFRTVGGGAIVNMGSIYGTMAPRFEVYDGTSMTMPVEYAAIKSAISHLTRYFAQYLRKDGIRVNSLSPGGIRDRQPESFLAAYASHAGTRGMLEPTDICGALIFLLSDASRFVTGQNLIVDDGFSL